MISYRSSTSSRRSQYPILSYVLSPADEGARTGHRHDGTSSRMGARLVALPLGAAQGVLHRAADATLGRKLFADEAVLVQRAADLLRGASKRTLLCSTAKDPLVRSVLCRPRERKKKVLPVNCLPIMPWASRALGWGSPTPAVAGVFVAEAMPPVCLAPVLELP